MTDDPSQSGDSWIPERLHLRPTWQMVDDTPSCCTLDPDVRFARNIASAVIRQARDDIQALRRRGILDGMQPTGRDPSTISEPWTMTTDDLASLIGFLEGPDLDRWIEYFGLHIRADSVRRYLRISAGLPQASRRPHARPNPRRRPPHWQMCCRIPE
jgi:hypothetical protein